MLTVSGVYGVVSFLVSQRTKEIGIRMALGATTARVVRAILGHSLKPAAAGMSLGLLLAFGVSRLLASSIFGIEPFDLVAYLGAPAIVALTAALAALAPPARRASRVDPAQTLRSE